MCLVFSEKWVADISNKYSDEIKGKPDDNESLVAGFLERHSYELEYERSYNNLTPDWTILNRKLNPFAIVEVLTINENPDEIIVSQPQVEELKKRIFNIPSGVNLEITLDEETVESKKLSSDVNKKIASNVESWLKNNSLKKGDSIMVENSKFEIVRFNEGQNVNCLTLKPKNLIKRFDVNHEIEKTEKKILKKITKYKEIVKNHDLYFVIGLIANSLVVKNKERINYTISQIIQKQHSLSAVIIFQKHYTPSCWEVNTIKNPNIENSSIARLMS